MFIEVVIEIEVYFLKFDIQVLEFFNFKNIFN